jgi:hypothetical protein
MTHQRPWFHWEQERSQRRLLPDVDETRLGVEINHGRRLAAIPQDWDLWESLTPAPDIDHPERGIDLYADPIASLLQAAAYLRFNPVEVAMRALQLATDLHASAVEDALARTERTGQIGAEGDESTLP